MTLTTLFVHPAGLVDCYLADGVLWVLDPGGRCTAYPAPAGGWAATAGGAVPPAPAAGSHGGDPAAAGVSSHPVAVCQGPGAALTVVDADGLLVIVDSAPRGGRGVLRRIPLPSPVLSCAKSPLFDVLALGTPGSPAPLEAADGRPGVMAYFAADGSLARIADFDRPPVSLGFSSLGRYVGAVWGGCGFGVCDLARRATVSATVPGISLTLAAGTDDDLWVAGVTGAATSWLLGYSADRLFWPELDPESDASHALSERVELSFVACALDTDPDGAAVAAGGLDGSLCVLDGDYSEPLVNEVVHDGAVVRTLFAPGIDGVISAAMDGTVRMVTWAT